MSYLGLRPSSSSSSSGSIFSSSSRLGQIGRQGDAPLPRARRTSRGIALDNGCHGRGSRAGDGARAAAGAARARRGRGRRRGIVEARRQQRFGRAPAPASSSAPARRRRGERRASPAALRQRRPAARSAAAARARRRTRPRARGPGPAAPATPSQILSRRIATNRRKPSRKLARAVSPSIALAAMTIETRSLSDSEISGHRARGSTARSCSSGMMGVGKSTVGRRWRSCSACRSVDADDEIEKAAQLSVAEIFERFGEAHFRDGERRVIARLIDGGPEGARDRRRRLHPARTRALILEQRHRRLARQRHRDAGRARRPRKDTRPLLRGRRSARDRSPRLQGRARAGSMREAPIHVTSDARPARRDRQPHPAGARLQWPVIPVELGRPRATRCASAAGCSPTLASAVRPLLRKRRGADRHRRERRRGTGARRSRPR